MTDAEWRTFFLICAQVLGPGEFNAAASRSWCAWTTFDRLTSDTGYWTAGLPGEEHLMETYTVDGGPWMQPFSYQSLAHVVIPREFYWETVRPGHFDHGTKQQDIATLSRKLSESRIRHRLTELVLEVKLY
ncbi:MAG TPA: hypothetical protein VET46_15915 [Steroidobacteraceae bacterium]|nr:hypothetical protein [Steroidobacteraceae bacterium]